MDAAKTTLLLLLPCLAYSFDSEVTLVKTIGKEPDFTPICTNETSNIIMMIMCRIKERSSGEECRLLYRDGGDFVHECDSRFTLKTMNQTVFLQLTNLTPADSGNYSCLCSNLDGTFVLLLSITVEDPLNEDQAEGVWSQSAGFLLPSAVTAAVLVIVVFVIVGFINRRRLHCSCRKPETSGSSVHESSLTMGEVASDEVYASLQQPTADIYQTVSSGRHQYETETNFADNIIPADLENLDRNSNCDIYENI